MFKTMDPDRVRELLKGQHDIIAEEAKREEEFYSRISCPMCFARGCQKRIEPPKIVAMTDGPPVLVSSPFVEGRALPQGFAHCIHCGTDFDPYTGFIRKTEASHIKPVDLDPASKIASSQSEFPQE